MATEVVCVRIRLRPGSTPRVREWAKVIADRRSEALATLEDEGVTIESVFLEHASDGDYLIYYMRAPDPEAAARAAADSPHPIDRYHQQFKTETWDHRDELELLVDLERAARA